MGKLKKRWKDVLSCYARMDKDVFLPAVWIISTGHLILALSWTAEKIAFSEKKMTLPTLSWSSFSPVSKQPEVLQYICISNITVCVNSSTEIAPDKTTQTNIIWSQKIGQKGPTKQEKTHLPTTIKKESVLMYNSKQLIIVSFNNNKKEGTL